ncbi:hypothetical protein H4Q26_016181 [Puccinia striiformis f. sp. tritici PST-130]|nr:hypothetical protein H4Q26_016181 [Puccinia striiformis f. sp. tritici PST-130]
MDLHANQPYQPQVILPNNRSPAPKRRQCAHIAFSSSYWSSTDIHSKHRPTSVDGMPGFSRVFISRFARPIVLPRPSTIAR